MQQPLRCFFLGTVTALLVPSPMARSTKRRIRMALELKSYPLIHRVQFARAEWGWWIGGCFARLHPFFSSIDRFAMSASRIMDSTCEFTGGEKMLISLICFCFRAPSLSSLAVYRVNRRQRTAALLFPRSLLLDGFRVRSTIPDTHGA